jgi:probable HAF family extracellular repeat protein
MKRFLMLVAAFGVSAALVSVPRAAAVTAFYSWTDLASPGQATAINDAGTVVGTSGGDAGTGGASFAFVWSSSTGLQLLTSSADFPGAGATAVSANGIVVGYRGMRAFEWTPAGGLVDLGRGIARAVNASGVAVGDDLMHPTVWMPAGETIDLFAGSADTGTATDVNAEGRVVGIGHPDYSSSYVFTWTAGGGLMRIVDAARWIPTVKVNDAGAVAGTYTVPPFNSPHGFVWTATGGLVDLGELVLNGGTMVADVNAHGAVVGYGYGGPTIPPAQHAFLWTPERGLTDLGTLGGRRSFATAIADDGTVVGYSMTTGSTVFHAFVWTPDTGMLDLGFPSEESESLAVNSSGWIVGYTGASNMGGPTGHAMLWRPSDLVPPNLILPLDITVDATSPAGAVVNYTVGATDNVDPNPIVDCTPASGTTFSIGDTPVGCTATDATGNRATASFNIHARGASEQVTRLIALVATYQLAQLGTSLTDKLGLASGDLAASQPADAAEMLRAFTNQVKAQSGKALTTQQAGALQAAATNIQRVIGY